MASAERRGREQVALTEKWGQVFTEQAATLAAQARLLTDTQSSFQELSDKFQKEQQRHASELGHLQRSHHAVLKQRDTQIDNLRAGGGEGH